MSRCKLLYTGWINKARLHSMGNYSQCSVINRDGRDYRRMHTA